MVIYNRDPMEDPSISSRVFNIQPEDHLLFRRQGLFVCSFEIREPSDKPGELVSMISKL